MKHTELGSVISAVQVARQLRVASNAIPLAFEGDVSCDTGRAVAAVGRVHARKRTTVAPSPDRS
jgi:hypothetical protein